MQRSVEASRRRQLEEEQKKADLEAQWIIELDNDQDQIP
jgi:hypothetical protein